MLGEATLDVSGTFAGEAIRFLSRLPRYMRQISSLAGLISMVHLRDRYDGLGHLKVEARCLELTKVYTFGPTFRV